MNKVTTAVSKAIQVAKYFREFGYGSVAARREERVQRVLLYLPVHREIRIFSWTLPFKSRDYFYHVADFWIENLKFNAVENKNWVVHVYGEENLRSIEEHAKKLSERFKVTVHLRLEREACDKIATSAASTLCY